jgi:predicted nucleic acid-binding protein
MKVISNSSILIGLSAIGRLELLHRRFPEGVIVPDAVWQEVYTNLTLCTYWFRIVVIQKPAMLQGKMVYTNP